MIIKNEIIKKINNFVTDFPPERGGIIGSSENEIIDTIVFDNRLNTNQKRCSYTPDVEFFNKIIDEWQNNNISFFGIFHTHHFGVKTLSDGDKYYIKKILNAMPKQIIKLYFPLFVLPSRDFICYKAIQSNKTIVIESEEVIIN